MPRSGTLVICVQNLDFSGANQVVLNIVAGRMHESNVVVLSPKVGAFAARFVESGAAVRVGILQDLLNEIRDVFCIICNTIMTANIVCEMSDRPHPVIWILHEWWDDEMIIENLRIRNYEGLNLSTVKRALAKAAMVVCVCESQRQLYRPTAPSTVIFVGVPDPSPRMNQAISDFTPEMPDAIAEVKLSNGYKSPNFTFLCLGIICPRKNQLWTVQLFKKFAGNRTDVRLQVVGARYTRVYEIDYLEQVKAEIGDDPRIKLYDVTDNVEPYYKTADCLILTSLNEVTPMVISEAMSWGIPVLSTNIAGIKEMYIDGMEGYHFDPSDEAKALQSMHNIYNNTPMRNAMGKAARMRFETTFDLDLMVQSYRDLVLKVAPPVVLLDMDGALINWDKGFLKVWGNRSTLDRTKSYFIEECVPHEFRSQAVDIFMEKGFFENLEPMEGALEAVKDMEEEGYKLYICTTPVKHSKYCAQEKINWVAKHLGDHWIDRIILCHDKTMVAGDLLIDDKPYEYLSPGGKHTTATWKQIIFDAPYNRQMRLPRLFAWRDWRSFVSPMLGKNVPLNLYCSSREEVEGKSSDPFCRPSFINVGPAQIKRSTSVSSAHSGLSADEVQHKMDMYQQSDTPLNPGEMASIVSSSASLMGDDDSSDEESIYEGKLLHHQREPPIQKLTETVILEAVQPKDLAEKKKALQDRLQARSEQYKKVKESKEKQMAMETDPTEVEGLQLFRNSYDLWKRISGAGARSSASNTPSGVQTPVVNPLEAQTK